MKKLIVVADDFGWTEQVNKGILKTYKKGLVTEISLMIGAPASKDAIKIIKKEKIVDVGLHLGLVPFSKENIFMKRDDYINLFKEKTSDEIEELVTTELNEFEEQLNSTPTHIIPQYGIHGNLKLLQILISYCKKNKVAMRLPKTVLTGNFSENYAGEIMIKRENIKTTEHLFAYIEGNNNDKIKKQILDDLNTVGDGETTEILFHPGYFDEKILKLSSLNYERARDIAICLDKELINKVTEMGFQIVSYKDL